MAVDVVTTQLCVIVIVALLGTLLMALSGPPGDLKSDYFPVTNSLPLYHWTVFPKCF